MARHEKLLNEWVSHKLISEPQAVEIRKYESQKPSSALYSFLILGVVIIGIGLISVIAANWKDIPDALKLMVDFLLLFAAGYGAFAAWENNKPIVLEVVLAFLLILTLASIGLISQIFHTGGHLYQALLLWSCVTGGVMLASEKKFVPTLWTAGFFGGIVLWGMDSQVLEIYFHKDPAYILAALPFLASVFAVVSRMVSGESGHTEAFRNWVAMAGLIGLMAAENEYRTNTRELSGFISAYLLALITLAGILVSSEYRNIQKILLSAAIFFFLAPFHFPLFQINEKVIYAANSVIVLGLLAVFFASIRQRNLFQFFLTLVGLRFLVLYFQALGGLAATGVGLIISGTLIVGAATLWNKHRKAFAGWVEDLVG